MKRYLMFLFVVTVGFVPFAAAQQSVQQCVENQVREMMDEARNATSDREVLAMMEAEIRKNLAAFQEDCQKEAAQRSAQPPPANSEILESRKVRPVFLSFHEEIKAMTPGSDVRQKKCREMTSRAMEATTTAEHMVIAEAYDCIQDGVGSIQAVDRAIQACPTESVKNSIRQVRAQLVQTYGSEHPPVSDTDHRIEPAPARPGIGLKRKPAAAEPEFKNADSTPDTGDRSLHGEGLGTRGDMRTTRTNALAGSWEFSSGLIDRSGSLAVAPVTITVINKSPCVMHTDGSLTLDKGTLDEEVFAPFSFSGVKIRPYGTFRKEMRIRLTNDKKHQLYGHIMRTVLFECPGS